MSSPPADPSPVHATAGVVLGSGSAYRRELLARLLPAFEVVVPEVDEAPMAHEPAATLAGRLADLKATAVAARRPRAIVIGSDQVAECGGHILGKPGNEEKAIAQLSRCAGRVLSLYTAVCLLAPQATAPLRHVDYTRLRFRDLSAAQIARYVRRDRPLECAGSFRFESLGAALFTSVETTDPTAIQGLPLLWLAGALGDLGIDVL